LTTPFRKRREAINTIPHLYDGRDVLQHSVQKTINSSAIYDSNSAFFVARTVVVRRNTDPTSEILYTVIARMTELDKTVPEPEVYTQISQENVSGLSEYVPFSPELDEPPPGSYIKVGFVDLKNRTGPIYYGLYKDFKLDDIKGDKRQNLNKVAGPSKIFER
jgi:hypothetical protein